MKPNFCTEDALYKAVEKCVPPRKAHLIDANKRRCSWAWRPNLRIKKGQERVLFFWLFCTSRRGNMKSFFVTALIVAAGAPPVWEPEKQAAAGFKGNACDCKNPAGL